MSNALPAIEPIDRETFIEQLEAATGRAIDPVAGIYGPGSMMWRLGRESLAFLGGGRAALLQLAHPWVANAINEHSATRDDPVGRFRRTFINVFTMLFGSVDQVLAVSRNVHHIHARISGTLPEDSGAFAKGSHYLANEASSMLWVHATLWEGMVRMYELVFPPLSQAEKEAFYEETKLFAMLFGIRRDVLPPDWTSFMAYFNAMLDSDQIVVRDVGREMGQMLFKFDIPGARLPLGWIEIMTAELMPAHLRDGFGLPEHNARNTAIYDRSLQMIRRAYPHLPKQVRYVPPFIEAQRRMAGYHQPNWATAMLNRVWVGQPRLVSA